MPSRIAIAILKPVLRLLLDHGLRFKELIELLKAALVEIGREEILSKGSKANCSRISLLTGLYRRDVNRIFRQDEPLSQERPTVVMQVLNYWEHAPEYQTKAGKPRIISSDGPGSEFWQLVEKVSQNYNPRSVLFEIERLNLVSQTPRGLRLLAGGQLIPGNSEEGLKMLAQDMDSLVRAVYENIYSANPGSNLHLRTEFDNVFFDSRGEIATWLREEGRQFHRRVREYLSNYDADIAPKSQGRTAGIKVTLGTFSITRLPSESTTQETAIAQSASNQKSEAI